MPPLTPPPSAGATYRTSFSVFSLIHELHATVTQSIDTSLTWEQINSPPINYTLVRPIVERFAPKRDGSGGKSKIAGGLLRAPEIGDSVESGVKTDDNQAGGIIPLGALLYALMANRYV